MRLVILRSVPSSSIQDPFVVKMDTQYAERLIQHINNQPQYCQACGNLCQGCRQKLDLNFSNDIVGIYDFPSILPGIVDDPEEYLPSQVVDHDILLAVAVNEEIIISFIKKFPIAQGIIIPIEGSHWISPHAITIITQLCKEKGIEIAAPKPFCSFAPKKGYLLAFREYFRIGKPELDFTVDQENTITKVEVKFSAPCGATYFTSKGLIDKKVTDDLIFILDKQLSCYPCTADTAVDREFRDSIIHQAVKIQRDVLQSLYR